ncbi:hypothetical protein AB0D99_16805 [Streptomyces sp. NPDC047971]|uniref:hypothetical protein n=1 Tax=Streptomyces sp. NPDC047971 TaxID=3154499 RepID=UPI0033CB580A
MRPIAEFAVSARPDRGFVEVYDADAILGDDEAFRAARDHVVAGDGYHLYLYSLQPDIRVRVAIRLWESAPPPPADAEGHTPVTLDSETGILVIGQLALGPAGTMDLPQPGLYEGTAWWVGRRATSDYYDQTLRQLAGDASPELLTQAWAQCPTREQYVLDLGRAGESRPEAEWHDEVTRAP